MLISKEGMMTGIIVLDKSTLVTLQNSENKHIVLNQASIVRLGYSKEDITSVEYAGNNAIIILKNGEKIILENFFVDGQHTPHQVVLTNSKGIFEELVITVEGYHINYDPKRVVDELEQSQAAVQQPQAATVEETEKVAWYEKELVKPVLILLGLEGIYLAAFHDKDDDDSSSTPDLIAPATPSASLDADGKVLTGKSEAGATIYVKDINGKLIGEATVDADGNFKLNLDREIINNEKVLIYAKDPAGNESKSTVITGTKDTIAPDAANAQINAEGSIISGKAEAGAKIYIYDVTGKNLLAGPVTVAADGTFSISLKPALAQGDEAKVIVEDTAGNKSESSSVIVGQDTLAPEQPTVEVSQSGDQVQGYAEANSKVQIKNSDGVEIGSGVADDQGYFSIQIKPALAEKDSATINVTDEAGNQSADLAIEAGMDTIAPDAVSAELNSDGTEVTGQAGANQKIEIYNKDGTLIGAGKADESGKFTITLDGGLTDKAVADIYTYDEAGNRSETTKVVGTKDTIAPNKVVLKTVTDDVGTENKETISNKGQTDDARPEFAGTGESGAIVTIYDNGLAIATVTVDNTGKWTFTPAKDLALGEHSFTFTQMDAATNSSAMSDPFHFTVIAPEQAKAEVTTAAFMLEDDHAISTLLDTLVVEEMALPMSQTKVVDQSEAGLNALLQQQENMLSQQYVDHILNEFSDVPSQEPASNNQQQSTLSDFSIELKNTSIDEELLQSIVIFG